MAHLDGLKLTKRVLTTTEKNINYVIRGLLNGCMLFAIEPLTENDVWIYVKQEDAGRLDALIQGAPSP